MLKFRLIILSLIIFCTLAVAAQTDDGKAAEEKQKQQAALLEQIAKDADALRLPENRALVLAKLGDAFWTSDEKRAREFFKNSVNALLAAQAEAEAEKKAAGNLYGLLYGTSPRQEILTMIAARDAEFALDAFYKSRPAKIAEALTTNGAEPKNAEARQYGLNEATFEQTLINKFSEQNPSKALEMFRANLARGVTYESIGLVEKLKAKDLPLANQLAGEIADRFLATDFDKDDAAASLAISFATEYGKKPAPDQKTVKVADQKLRDLAAKVIRKFLASEDGNYLAESLLPLAEKYTPENVAALKRVKAKFDSENKREDYEAYSKLVEENASPEKLLSEAEKYKDDLKTQIYYAAAEKAAQNGNVAQAKKIISSKLPAEERENYLTQMNAGLIAQALTAGKFDEAALLINQIPAEESRFYYLIELATNVYQKNPAENKRAALGYLAQARDLVRQPTETLEDIAQTTQIAASLAEIDATQAFPLVESLTYQMNEFLDASVIVAKYRGDATVRKNEMIINSYGGVEGLSNLPQILTTLRQKDFARAAAFVNNFQRPEVRVSLELQLIEPPAAEVPTVSIEKPN